MNTVENIETFVSDINNGRWDSVVSQVGVESQPISRAINEAHCGTNDTQVATLSLPRFKLVDLYEQVGLVFILQCYTTCKSMLYYIAAPVLRVVMIVGQIIIEMLELRETETARALLRNTAAMQELKVHDWERYRRIEDVLSSAYFDAADVWLFSAATCATSVDLQNVQAYGDSTKERRRSQLASCGCLSCPICSSRGH